MTTVVLNPGDTWTAPSGVTLVDCAAWGESGSAANGVNGSHSGGGAGAGGFSEETALAVTPGTLYTPTIGTGGTNTATTFPGDSVTVTANAGASATTVNGAIGGAASGNTISNAGGHGGNGATGTNKGGGGGGGSGGSGSAGGTGGTGTTVGGSGGTAGTGTNAGAAGTAGGGPTSAGGNGTVPGGGPGGGGNNGNRAGGNAVAGQITLTYSAPASGTATLTGAGTLTAGGSVAGAATLTGTSILTAARSGAGNATLTGTGTLTAGATLRAGATLTGTGTLTAGGGLPVPAVVNQWSGTFTQPADFSSMPPSLQSVAVPLTPAYSVGGGSGSSTPGNWLFALVGMNEQFTTSGFTVGDSDDIHSWWRPGKVSTATALTRTSIWYTPNIARQVNDVYVSPNGAMDAMTVLVVEISGLGPWDTVTGVYANYAAAAASLNLTLGAPGAPAFLIAAVTGDSTASTQAFTPSGWTPLSTVTVSNGVDHSCDSVLTSAILPSTSGSVSVNGTASPAVNLSGVIIGVRVSGTSPLPSSPAVSPGWAGRMILEAGFGAGFETPQDQVTWTVLNDSTVAPTSQVKRFWGWADQGGIPYGLAQLQSGAGTATLDDADGYLTPSNSTTSPYYPNVTTGTPLRLRAALGTVGGNPVNRWYVLAKYMLDAQEKRTGQQRTYIESSLTDLWGVVAGTCPSPYRGEILSEASLYSWYTMDDQPLSGGVPPTSLRNSAPGNTTVLNILGSPGGVTAGDAYTTDGIDSTTANTPPDPVNPPTVATYAVGQQAGFLYGDPQSSTASYATSNPVTASPGSAAWQQTGLGGNTGANGWFLAANDTYPGLAGGVTVKGWFNAQFFGTATGWHETTGNNYHCVAGQPYSAITLATLSTGSAPVCQLQLDLNGHLNLITFNGTTPTTNSVYSTSDLRSSSWHCVDIQLTQTTWQVLVDGGLTATASGTVSSMTSAWTWLTLNGDYGNTSGGSTPANIQHGGNVAYSHWTVFGAILPAWRLLHHYYIAACGAGVLPAPQTVALSPVINEFGTGYTPDGSAYQGGYGKAGSSVTTFTFSGLAVAQAGTCVSGPSARAVTAGLGGDTGGIYYGNAVWLSYTGLAPSFLLYTAASADAETSAAVVCGPGDAFTGGFGASAADTGVCVTGNGTGAAPPSGPTPLGDTVGQRIERILGYGQVTCPNRAIDQAPEPVGAALDVGGQSVGANIQAQVDSDNGLLFTDNNGTLCYREKSHLAADTVVWDLSSAGPAYGIPFLPGQVFQNDPQKVYTVIQVTPYSPDGATLPVIVPVNATAVAAAQKQYGPRPLQVTSYLQSAAAQQAQANWLFSTYGQLERRADPLMVDAAQHPAAWLYFFGVNVGDLVSITDQPMQGGPLTTGTYRVTSVSRRVFFGAHGSKPEASVSVTADPVPASYWS